MKNLLIGLGIIVFVALLGFGVYSLTATSSNTTPATSPTNSSSVTPSAASQAQPSTSGKTISSSELAKNNGKNGANCWVAVSGTVYDVTGSRDWVNGEHIPSNGAAKCGLDETSVIGQSPHGTSVLSNLPVIGSLQ